MSRTPLRTNGVLGISRSDGAAAKLRLPCRRNAAESSNGPGFHSVRGPPVETPRAGPSRGRFRGAQVSPELRE